MEGQRSSGIVLKSQRQSHSAKLLFSFLNNITMVVAREKMMSYEEIRQKRVEENKKRMEALNLPQLSSLLHTPSFKPSPVPSLCNSSFNLYFFIFFTNEKLTLHSLFNPKQRKQMKPRTVEKQLVVVRRSSRVANKPAPVYQEVSDFLDSLSWV